MTDAERHILEAIKTIWEYHEFWEFVMGAREIPNGERILFYGPKTSWRYTTHITAGDLRAAFGVSNPLIEGVKKQVKQD